MCIRDSNSPTDKAALQTEFDALRSQIDSIATGTTWNGEKVFSQSGTTPAAKGFQVGANAGQQISVTFNNFQTAGGTGTPPATQADSQFVALKNDSAGATSAISTIDLTTTANATQPKNAIYMVDHALEKLNTERATYGAAINRLEYAVDNLANISQNTAASRSRILDADYASESTELARTQIIQQAGTAMLAQANQQAQSVLALLK